MVQIMQHLTAFILITSVIHLINADESCSEEKLKECLSKIQIYFDDEYHFIKKTETELDEFCQNLQQDSVCLHDVSEDCKNTYRVVSALTTTIYNQVNQVCSAGTHHKETYMKVLPCVSKYSKEFDQCSGEHHRKKFDDEKLQSVCMDMHSMICAADKSRKYCGSDGESAAKLLEFAIKDKYNEVCSGCASIFDSCWIFTSVILFALLLSNKLQF